MYMRHGDASHFMRPDRIYRTGVIAPAAGYSPEQDVMAVAQAFTQGPYRFSQGQDANGQGPLSGLGATAIEYGYRAGPCGENCNCPGDPGCPDFRTTLFQRAGSLRGPNGFGLFQRLKYKFQAWRARRGARRFMGVAGLGGTYPGAAFAAGVRIAPAQYSRMQALALMAGQYQPSEWSQANTDAVMARWAHLRSSTR